MTRSEMSRTFGSRGFFGVCSFHPKSEQNTGTLWRSATTYGAAFVATIGRRYESQVSDTCETPLHTPLWHFDDIDDLHKHLPHGCQMVGIELTDDSMCLTRFMHPHNALYILGAEDHGLPTAVLERCHHVVKIPTPAPWSLNVSVAGSLVLHDRYQKEMRHAREAG